MIDWAPLMYRNTPEENACLARAELSAAIAADRKNRKFPPMETMAWLLSSGLLPEAEKTLLADFIAGKHRGKKGEKSTQCESRNIDINRALDFSEYVQEGMSPTDAYQQVLLDENNNEDGGNTRTIERGIKRGLTYLEEDAMEAQAKLLQAKFELEQQIERLERYKRLEPFMQKGQTTDT